MIKTYRKIATIQAEQFDGSKEIREKYGIITSKGPGEFGSDVYGIKTLEGIMRLDVTDWIATGVKGEHWTIDDDVFKVSYVEAVE